MCQLKIGNNWLRTADLYGVGSDYCAKFIRAIGIKPDRVADARMVEQLD